MRRYSPGFFFWPEVDLGYRSFSELDTGGQLLMQVENWAKIVQREWVRLSVKVNRR